MTSDPCNSAMHSEEKAVGKLPGSFSVGDILIDRFVKEAADSVNCRFGKGCE